MIVAPSATLGGLTSQSLGGSMTQFGPHLQTLAPGATTGPLHWLSAEDECAQVLDGAPTLPPGGEILLSPGMALASHPVIGTRRPAEVTTDPDDDLIAHKDGQARRYTRLDGAPR